MSIAQLKNLCLEMKLQGFLLSLDQTLKEASDEAWSPPEILDTLLQAEHDFREQRKTQTRIKSSRLKQKASLEDFDFSAKRNLNKSQIKDLYSLQWLRQGRPLLIMGQTGVGKTFLAEALGLQACRNQCTTLFLSMSSLIENLILSRTSGSYLKFRDKISKPQLLIIDDFGLKKLTTTEAHDLCEILEERSTEKSTVITTQLPLSHWKEVIPDPVIADAIIDRLIHAAIKLTITGESYRKVKAQKLDSRKEAA